MTTVRYYDAYSLVSIHRRTEGSTGARPETRLFTRSGRNGGEATSMRRVAVERAPVARGGTHYGLRPAELAAK